MISTGWIICARGVRQRGFLKSLRDKCASQIGHGAPLPKAPEKESRKSDVSVYSRLHSSPYTGGTRRSVTELWGPFVDLLAALKRAEPLRSFDARISTLLN